MLPPRLIMHSIEIAKGTFKLQTHRPPGLRHAGTSMVHNYLRHFIVHAIIS